VSDEDKLHQIEVDFSHARESNPPPSARNGNLDGRLRAFHLFLRPAAQARRNRRAHRRPSSTGRPETQPAVELVLDDQKPRPRHPPGGKKERVDGKRVELKWKDACDQKGAGSGGGRYRRRLATAAKSPRRAAG